MASGSLTAARPPGFSVTFWPGSYGTASAAADDHPVIPHARINGINFSFAESFWHIFQGNEVAVLD